MAQQTASSSLDRFLLQVRSSGLVRRTDSRWLAGVCSGVAARLGVDPVIVRVAFVVLGFFFGAGVIAYLVGWCLLPNAADDTIVLERAVRDTEPVAILLLVLLAISVVTPFSNGGRSLSGLLLAGIGVIGIWWWSTERRPAGLAGSDVPSADPAPSMTPHAGTPDAPLAVVDPLQPVPVTNPAATDAPSATTPSPTSPLSTSTTQGIHVSAPYEPIAPSYTPTPTYQPPSYPPPTYQPHVVTAPKPRRERGGWPLFLFAVGATLVVTQILRLLHDATDWGIRSDVLMLAGIAATLGVILVAAGLRGYRGGIVSVAAIIAAVSLVGTMSTPDIRTENAGGNVRWAPTQVSDLRTSYELTFANGTLDLTGLPAATLSNATTKVDVTMGNLTVIVPRTATVTVSPDVTMGNLDWTDTAGEHQSVSGFNKNSSPIVLGTGASQLTVNADVTMGNLTIERK